MTTHTDRNSGFGSFPAKGVQPLPTEPVQVHEDHSAAYWKEATKMAEHTDRIKQMAQEAGSCTHTWTRTERGKTGSWCAGCGVKVYDVDHRECKDCAHHERLIGGSICRKHLMGVTQDMHVTFKISEGSCWTPKPSAPATA